MYSPLWFIIAKGARATGKGYALEGVQRSQEQASESFPFINHIRCTIFSSWEMQRCMLSVTAQGSLLKSQDPKILWRSDQVGTFCYATNHGN